MKTTTKSAQTSTTSHAPQQILVINPGSTSTKIAVYHNETSVFVQSISHSTRDLQEFPSISSQLEFREKLVLDTLAQEEFVLTDFTCIVARGGVLPPVHAGAYTVGDDMVWQLTHAPAGEHASNLGALIGYHIAQPLHIPCYIYDGVSVDEMPLINKLTGWKEIQRNGHGHNLNMRATALRYAQEQGKEYADISVVVAHLGGGFSISLHHQGRIVDILNDEVGSFTPERAGALPMAPFVEEIFKEKMDKTTVLHRLKTQGGLTSHLGTNDSIEVEKRIANGDRYAQQVYQAMAMNLACNIARQFPIVDGKVEAILLTGGMAHSALFTGMVAQRLAYLCPVKIYAGENEMQSLALGALRIQRGQEKPQVYQRVEE